jgi:hypothetical protein
MILFLERGGMYRVGFVDNEEMISCGRLERKAPRQLIVRGTYMSRVNINVQKKERATNPIEPNALEANLSHQLSCLHGLRFVFRR